jgi:hypothetical protein
MGVDLGGFQGLMAKKFLDMTDGRTVAQHEMLKGQRC